MTKPQAAERVAKLREAIDRYRYEYHVLDATEISDAALDSLKHELFQLEQQFPELVTPDSPTQRVGGKPLARFAKVPHARPMLSMEDVFSFEELTEWRDRVAKAAPRPPDRWYCEMKMDGLAVSLVYQDGRLVTGATRGDGRVGEDVTQNLRTIEAIPLRLRRPSAEEVDEFCARHSGKVDERAFRSAVTSLAGRIEVRGEVFMPKKNFAALNKAQEKAGLPAFANPRNVSAGSIRQLDPALVASRGLDFFGYALHAELGLAAHHQEHEVLAMLGVKTNPESRLCHSLEEIEKLHAAIGKKRAKLDYWTDGVVVNVDDDATYEAMGVVGKTPRGTVAYKFPAEQVTTVVEDIRVQVGRTGALTPVARLRASFVAGTTVTHASLHNMDEIGRLGLKIGDTVILQKSGDIIPKVIKVLPELRTGAEREFRMPKKCPVCESQVARPEGEVAYYCTNKGCAAQAKERIIHFVSKHGIDIPGLGEKAVERFLEEGTISDVADLYHLKAEDLAELDRFADISAAKLVASIQSRRQVALARFLNALGIRHVGEETADDLARHFGTFAALRAASQGELENVPGVGVTVAASVREYFDNAGNAKALDRLLAEVEVLPAEKRVPGPLTGKVFVLTGTMEAMGRDAAKGAIRKLGGETSETVNKATSFLVAGESAGSKLDKAQKLGVPVLNEAEFLRMLGQS
jgi:DNA ligase (NAD+)